MNRFVGILLFLGYGLCYWGSTLLGGGPGDTGAWPLLYTLTKLGAAPQEPPTKGGAQETPPTPTPQPGPGPATPQPGVPNPFPSQVG